MKKWVLRKSLDKKAEENLKNYPDLTRKLLFYRGMETAEDVENYLNPSYERDLLDPFLMVDMDKAAERVITAIQEKEKIVIFGDYDADGVPGAVILETFLKRIGYNDFVVYIPDRYLESHGLGEKSVNFVKESGAKLLITVDAGITNSEAVKEINDAGVEVIITDHHLVNGELPSAYAVVDAKRDDDNYPFKVLAGAGVAFKLVCAILAKNNFALPAGWEKWLLDLVAISTVSDMVPMLGENRLLTLYGLKVLKKTKRLGLLSLMGLLKIKPEFVSEDDIAFLLGPHINSAGRMSHASQAYYLLRTDDEIEALTIARHLIEKNKERRQLVETIIHEVAEKSVVEKMPAVLVAGGDNWGLGVLGLAATRLVEKYERPVFIWSKNAEGMIKGSCRSDGSVNLLELMAAAGGAKIFSNFGGHLAAAGFSVLPGKEEKLSDLINKAYQKIDKEKIEISIPVDLELRLEDVTWENYNQIEKIGPFGVDNPKPIFLFKNLEIAKARTFGNGGIHLEVVFKNPQGQDISAIGFFACPPDLLKKEFDAQNGHNFTDVNLAPGRRVDLLANLEKSTFKFRPELRLRIIDLQKAS